LYNNRFKAFEDMDAAKAVEANHLYEMYVDQGFRDLIKSEEDRYYAYATDLQAGVMEAINQMISGRDEFIGVLMKNIEMVMSEHWITIHPTLIAALTACKTSFLGWQILRRIMIWWPMRYIGCGQLSRRRWSIMLAGSLSVRG
jgi:hypothetical protein